jgi:hypothetical protein
MFRWKVSNKDHFSRLPGMDAQNGEIPEEDLQQEAECYGPARHNSRRCWLMTQLLDKRRNADDKADNVAKKIPTTATSNVFRNPT